MPPFDSHRFTHRRFLQTTLIAGGLSAMGKLPVLAETAPSITLPFEREKRPLLKGRKTIMGLLKKAASSVLAIFLCSRTDGTLRAQNCLRPCWMNFFDQPLAVGVSVIVEDNMAHAICIIQHTHYSTLSSSRGERH